MDKRKRKIFIQSVFPAPYRVGVFKELNKAYDIYVVFERKTDANRSNEWFVQEFGFEGIVLGGEGEAAQYKDVVRDLKSYDAVLAYDYTSISSAKLMLRCISKGIPYFLNCDGAFLNRNPFKRMAKSFFVKRAKACFASGEHAEKYFLANGAKMINIYRHPFSSLFCTDILIKAVSHEEKMMIREQIGWPLDKNIVLSIGQFTNRKGFDILLQAWKSIDQESVLVIVGGGENEKDYFDFIARNDLKNVKIESYKPKKQLFDYYKAADLFVLPTREDIWGLVINEAMACGLPIITTDKCIAGLELISDGLNGFIVPADDAIKLEEILLLVLKNQAMRDSMGQSNLEKIKEYTIENIAASHIRVLDSVLGERQ